MTPTEHRQVADTVESIAVLVGKLTGYPSDSPACFKSYNDNVKSAVHDNIINIFAKELKNNKLELSENPTEARKFKKLMTAIIEACETK